MLLMIILSTVSFLFVILISTPLTLWFQCLISACDIPFGKILNWYIKREDVKTLVETKILLTKADVNVDYTIFEKHYYKGGNIKRLGQAVVMLHLTDQKTDLKLLKKLDLEDVNIIKIIESAVNPIEYSKYDWKLVYRYNLRKIEDIEKFKNIEDRINKILEGNNNQENEIKKMIPEIELLVIEKLG